MRLCVVMLGLLFLAGCDKPIITIDLKGQPSIPAQPAQPAQPAPPRFQLVVHPEYPGKFTYLLDTQTGALWVKKEFPHREGNPTAWVQEDFEYPTVPSSAQNPIGPELFSIMYPLKKEEVKP